MISTVVTVGHIAVVALVTVIAYMPYRCDRRLVERPAPLPVAEVYKR